MLLPNVLGLIKTYQPLVIVMDVDKIFSHPFHSRVADTHSEIAGWKLKPIVRFPYTEFIVEGDVFFKKVWQLIDRSKEYFWMTTYAIDSSPAADTTLLKLIEACKRGVNVVLFIDNVQYWAKQ
jgi:phosphatidylserine/phosphatidylglycerophosphate/cardiolipin synthase-like enzyme